MAILGIDVGGSFIKAGIIANEQLASRTTLKVETSSYDAFLQQLVNLYEEAQGRESLEWVGIGLPGAVRFPDGAMTQSPHLPFLEERVLREDLPAAWNSRVVVGNDVSFAAYGEYTRHPEVVRMRPKVMVYLSIGTGLGGGVILNGEILWGGEGFAGEFGHMSLDPNGPPCACGSNGCLEVYTSATGILRMIHETLWKYPDSSLRRFHLGSLRPEDVFEAARFGDEAAREVVEQAALALGVGLGNTINMLNPDVIVVGGGVMGSNEFFLQRAAQLAAKYTFRAPYQHCKILPSHLRYYAGVWGAALFARDYFHKVVPSATEP